MSGTSFTQSMISFIFWMWEYYMIDEHRANQLYLVMNNKPFEGEDEDYSLFTKAQKTERLKRYIIKTNIENRIHSSSDSFFASLYVELLTTHFEDDDIMMLSLQPPVKGMSSLCRSKLVGNSAYLFGFYKKYQELILKDDYKCLPQTLQKIVKSYDVSRKLEKELRDLGLLSPEMKEILLVATEPSKIILGENW